MEGEKRESEKIPEQKINIPQNEGKILGINSETTKEREAEEQVEIKELKKEIEKSFTDENPNTTEKSVNSPEKEFEEKSAQGKNESIAKKFGVFIGKSLSWMFGSLESRVKNFDVELSGSENLRELEGRPYILAANHIKPKNILMQAIGLSPDSFVIRRVVQEETQRMPHVIANVSSKIRKIPIFGQIDKIWSPFREGIMQGAGFIPVKMRRGGESTGFNRNFIERFREVVDKKEPVIIFPQGHWDKDFNPEREFETGTATLARNYGLPIAPVYIQGCQSWSPKGRASVSIGQIIDPAEKNKEEITDEIKKSIICMKEVKAGSNDTTKK
ncbi:MAG: lysophospholipid acyltransferase family protein [Patescibacteria group bacterium]